MPEGGKPKKWNGNILAAMVIVVVGGIFLMLWGARIPVKAESRSPEGTYTLHVGWKLCEWVYFHAPVDVELHGYDSTKRLFTIQTRIEDDGVDAKMNKNIWIFWESDSRATVLLLGTEQLPEIITINFQGGAGHTPEITRERSSSKAQSLVLEHHISLPDSVDFNIGDAGVSGPNRD